MKYIRTNIDVLSVSCRIDFTIWFPNGARLTESKTWVSIFVFPITFVHSQP